jgi:hypothetical protein
MIAEGQTGWVNVFTTDNRGYTPEEIADRALDKLIYIGNKSHPAIREQAFAFREQLRAVLVHHMAEAQQSERVTIAAKLRSKGYPEIADEIGGL